MIRASSSKGATLTDAIVNALTQEIISKRLLPGAALDESRLAQQFGASRTPVREALRQLAASGLVELRTHRAPLVASADDGRLQEMFDVMAELEALCATRAALAMNSAARAQLEAHHLAMSELVRRCDTAAYRAANAAFHAMIYEGAGNRYLKELALGTRERLAPHRGAQLEAPARLAQSYAEHGEIVTAILRGESATAALAIKRHLAVTQSTLASISSALKVIDKSIF